MSPDGVGLPRQQEAELVEPLLCRIGAAKHSGIRLRDLPVTVTVPAAPGVRPGITHAPSLYSLGIFLGFAADVVMTLSSDRSSAGCGPSESPGGSMDRSHQVAGMTRTNWPCG